MGAILFYLFAIFISFLMMFGPYILLFGGVFVLIMGITTRVKTKNDFKPRGFALIICGALVMLPGLIICGGRGIRAVNHAIYLHNDISHQIYDGRVGDVERLLKHRADGRGESYSPEEIDELFIDVARYGDINPDPIEKAELLIEYGADINMTVCGRYDCKHDKEENREELCSATPLHIAAEYQNDVMIKFLIDNGADVNAVDYFGYTPLDIVEWHKDESFSRDEDWFIKRYERTKALLLQYGAKRGAYEPKKKPWR